LGLAAFGPGVYVNCIFRNSLDPEDTADLIGWGTATYSNVQGGYPGEGNIDSDPQFVDAAGGDLRLRPTSPSMDAGNSAVLPADALDLDSDGDTSEPIPLDLDYLPRVSGAAVDMGAYEVQALPPPGIDIKPGDPTNTISLAERGKLAVAILSTEQLNAPEQMDRAALTFGRAGDEPSLLRRKDNAPNCYVEDVDADGLVDLACYFLVKHMGFQPDDVEGVLKGLTLAGAPFEGRAAVQIAP
jgi:hypothetical protein